MAGGYKPPPMFDMVIYKPRIYFKRGKWWCSQKHGYDAAYGPTPVIAYRVWLGECWRG